MDFVEVYENLNKLSLLKKRTDKENLLIDLLNDETFSNVVKLALDTRYHYGISELSDEYMDFGVPRTPTTENEIIDFLLQLSTKPGTSDLEKYTLLQLASCNSETYDVVNRILSKNLRCGVGIKSINKIKSGFIEDIPYMRCSLLDKIENIEYPAIVEDKLDGEFINIICSRNSVTHRTRNGSYMNLLGNLITEFINITDNTVHDVVLCGEILTLGDDGEFLKREESNGIVLKSIIDTLTPEESEKIVVVLWDIINANEFYGNTKPTTPYIDRFSTLRDIVEQINSPKVRLVPHKIVNSYTEASNYFDDVVSVGGEGVVLKDFKAVFKNGDSVYQIKIKDVKVCELEVTGWSYGKKNTKFQNFLGSITCKSEDNIIIVDVGSGFTFSDRGYVKNEAGEYISIIDDNMIIKWNNTIGKICSIKFNSLTVDKNTGIYSMTNPIYDGIRYDKIVADTFEYITGL